MFHSTVSQIYFMQEFLFTFRQRVYTLWLRRRNMLRGWIDTNWNPKINLALLGAIAKRWQFFFYFENKSYTWSSLCAIFGSKINPHKLKIHKLSTSYLRFKRLWRWWPTSHPSSENKIVRIWVLNKFLLWCYLLFYTWILIFMMAS